MLSMLQYIYISQCVVQCFLYVSKCQYYGDSRCLYRLPLYIHVISMESNYFFTKLVKQIIKEDFMYACSSTNFSEDEIVLCCRLCVLTVCEYNAV